MNFHRNLVFYLTNESDIKAAAERGDLNAQTLCAAFTLVRDSNLRRSTTESQVRVFNDASARYMGVEHNG